VIEVTGKRAGGSAGFFDSAKRDGINRAFDAREGPGSGPSRATERRP